MELRNFDEAAVIWRLWRSAQETSDDVQALYEQAERIILSHSPTTPRQAEIMLGVVMDQAGERVDGLDRLALQRLQAFVNAY